MANPYMKNKLIFWLDGDLTHYCLSYYLQNKIDAELYAVIDVTNKPKKFYKEQKLVNFEKVWFYHDYIKELDKKPDLEYLSSMEEKYKLNLWEMACNDRILYRFNDYHKFTKNEILRILELEIRMYEDILNSIEPDFLITPETALRPHLLFHRMCKARGIKILMLNHANFENYCYISQDRHKMDHIPSFDEIESANLTLEDLSNRLKSFDLSKHLTNYFKLQKNSSADKIKAAFEFLFIGTNDNIDSHYTYFGRKRILVLIREILYSLKRTYRESFINKNFSYSLPKDSQFIYFPLHQEPERSLLIAAPFFTNQIETIRHVVKSLPMGYTLVVKEHPSQGPARGWRKISDYKEMLDIPNTICIHPSTPSDEILRKCSLVISVGGTSSFEAAFFGKPSIIFSDLDYSILPFIHKLPSVNELSKLIKKGLQSKVEPIYLEKYIKILESNSFQFDILKFRVDYQNHFYFGGNLIDVEITENQMEQFLSNHKDEVENLAEEYLKKINYQKHERL